MSHLADDHPFSSATTGVVTANRPATGGNIEHAADRDMFAVTLVAGTTYTFNLVRTNLGGLTDPVLQLYSPGEVLLASDDNFGTNGNSRFVYTATQSGSFYLGVMDAGAGSGMYTVSATSGVPTENISIGAPRTVIGEGDTALWTVTAPVSLAGTTSTYSFIGVGPFDLPNGLSAGQFTIGADGHATISTPLLNDAVTEGNETITLVLGTGQTLGITVYDTSRPASNVSTAANTLLGVYSAFYGQAPTSTAYASEVALYSAGTPAAYAADVAARFAATPNLALAGTVLNNLRITAQTTGGATPTESYTALRDALGIFFEVFPQAKGQVVLNLVGLLANLERDVTWGPAAILHNSSVGSMYQALPRLASTPELEAMGVADAFGAGA
jgi:hypothetical protein